MKSSDRPPRRPERASSAPTEPELSRASSRGLDAPDAPESIEAKPTPHPRLARVLVWVKRLAIAALVVAALAILAVVLTIRHFEEGLPSTDELKRYSPPQVTRVLARDGTLLGELFVERRTVVPIDEIPKAMKLAVLAAEDASFYEHDGLDYLGMLRAIAIDLRRGKARQGASTITQQVVKNVLLTNERTASRKIREAILAHRIEQELTKDEILDLYLNHIWFGHGRYGVEEASRYYFGKPVAEVTLAEAALLAAIPKGPSVYSPRTHLEKATARRTYVLDQMADKGFATREQTEAAKKEPVALAPEPDALPGLAPEAVDEVRRVLRSIAGPAAERGGYTVTTTIDPALEAAARAAVRRNLDEYAKRHKLLAPLAKAKREPAADAEAPKPGSHKVYRAVVTGADDARGLLLVKVGDREGTIDLRSAARYNPKALPASQFADVGKVVRVSLVGEEPRDASAAGSEPRARYRLELGPEGALVAIDVRTREILALVGSYEGLPGALDRAQRAHRQPGSTFKTFVYSYALHARALTPASLVETNPDQLHGYKPGNHDPEEGAAPTRVRDALAQSVNVSAAWAIEKVGPANVAAWAHAAGIESKLGSDGSLALGAYEVTPRELASAYATFAAGGTYEPPVLVSRIVGPNGVEIPLPPRAPSRRVMDEAEAYLTTSLLTSVVESGTGKRARALGRPIAGKTGTSNQSKDGWFVGYSPDVVCAVWTGYDDAAPLGKGEAGATVALPAFVDFMRDALKSRPVTDFAVPPGIVRLAIDPASGLRAAPEQQDSIEEVFLAGTEPTEVATPDADAGAPDAGVDGSALDADAGAAEPTASANLDTDAGSEPPPSASVLPAGDLPVPEPSDPPGPVDEPPPF